MNDEMKWLLAAAAVVFLWYRYGQASTKRGIEGVGIGPVGGGGGIQGPVKATGINTMKGSARAGRPATAANVTVPSFITRKPVRPTALTSKPHAGMFTGSRFARAAGTRGVTQKPMKFFPKHAVSSPAPVPAGTPIGHAANILSGNWRGNLVARRG